MPKDQCTLVVTLSFYEAIKHFEICLQHPFCEQLIFNEAVVQPQIRDSQPKL